MAKKKASDRDASESSEGASDFPSKEQQNQLKRRARSDSCYHPAVPKLIDPQLLDPFQTHPPTSEDNVDLLMKHCKCGRVTTARQGGNKRLTIPDFSTCVFNMFPFYPAPGKNPQTEYYAPIIYGDAVLFHVTLQLSALHLEKAHDKSDVRQSKRLMAECIRLLRERVQDSSDSGIAVSDETISAVARLAAIEASVILWFSKCFETNEK